MSQIPGWLAVLLASVQVLGALVAMTLPLVAVGGALVAFVSYQQRREADRKAEWWRRVEFALGLMMDYGDVVKVNTGMSLINALLDDPTATQEDGAMLQGVVDTAITMIVQEDTPGRRAKKPE